MRRRGFTLIELLIVVTVMAVLAAVALPRVRIEQAQVDGAARSINAVLLAARADAIGRGHNVLVVFDTANRTVRTAWDADNDLRISPGEKTRVTPLGERLAFQRGAGMPPHNGATTGFDNLRQLDGKPMLVVQRNGALDRATTLYLTSRRGQAGVGAIDGRALRLDRATGRLSVYVYGRTGWRLQ